MNLVAFRNFSLSYSQKEPRALNSIDLVIREKESVVISGLSGAGKSTLCLAAAGLLETFPAAVTEGEIARDRKEGKSGSGIAVVLQNFYAQISYLRSTVLEEIAFPCENLGLAREETARRVAEVIDRIRIGHLAHRNPLELSGGEKQKVVLAAALATEPDLLVLDEPLSQLDPETTGYLAGILFDLKNKMALLIAENNPYLTLKVADRLVVLAEGKVIADGPPEKSVNASTAEHLDLAAWTRCTALAAERGILKHNGIESKYVLDYRTALSKLRGAE